ncbi:hypothetical protein UK15_26180 [Streptomyces variegatus]|uniref:Uncharacterized protein n=1 Tax=Streptomyces variegatus TaxID=284040 RepID=A0A0M2GMS6_9ACTN|nr:hypothetical protein UK15_26180 [Streptomyces variegatus]
MPREPPGHASPLRGLSCLGRSLLVAGLTTAPSGPVMMATAPVSAALSKARGPKITLMGRRPHRGRPTQAELVLMSELRAWT